MTQALNLANLANNVNTSGQLAGSAVNGAVSSATNSTNLVTSDFSVSESGGKLYFYHSGTAIASLDSSGNFTSLANITAYGTP